MTGSAAARSIRKAVGAAAIMALAGWLSAPDRAEAQDANPLATVRAEDFPGCCPRPDWWDAVGPVPRVRNFDGFLEVWQDRALNNEQKSKALFQAIEDNRFRDDHVTAAAITYFFSVGRSYDHLLELTEYGVARYLDFDQPVTSSDGKSGNLAAGMARNLARLYTAAGEPERGVPVLRYILGSRRDEVNDHLLELAALYLAEAQAAMGRDDEAIATLLAAKRDFDGDWEPRLDKELASIRDRIGLAYYWHDQRMARIMLYALLGALLLVGVFWRRRPRLG